MVVAHATIGGVGKRGSHKRRVNREVDERCWKVFDIIFYQLLTICLLIGKPMYKLVNPEFTVSLHQL